MVKKSKDISVTYNSRDMADAHALAESDLNWALYVFTDVQIRLSQLKEELQIRYNVHEVHFAELNTFVEIYEYLLETRQNCHAGKAQSYANEWELMQRGQA